MFACLGVRLMHRGKPASQVFGLSLSLGPFIAYQIFHQGPPPNSFTNLIGRVLDESGVPPAAPTRLASLLRDTSACRAPRNMSARSLS
jgi:hypothetical protein